jgi:hypothetical protein
MAGLGLLGYLQHQVADPQLAALPRRRDPFDEQIGPARHPRKHDAKLATGALPSLSEKDRDLAVRLPAACVTPDAIGACDLDLIELDQGRPKGRRPGYSQQTSHIFTSIILQLVMNYTFVS